MEVKFVLIARHVIPDRIGITLVGVGVDSLSLTGPGALLGPITVFAHITCEWTEEFKDYVLQYRLLNPQGIPVAYSKAQVIGDHKPHPYARHLSLFHDDTIENVLIFDQGTYRVELMHNNKVAGSTEMDFLFRPLGEPEAIAAALYPPRPA